MNSKHLSEQRKICFVRSLNNINGNNQVLNPRLKTNNGIGYVTNTIYEYINILRLFENRRRNQGNIYLFKKFKSVQATTGFNIWCLIHFSTQLSCISFTLGVRNSLIYIQHLFIHFKPIISQSKYPLWIVYSLKFWYSITQTTVVTC